MKRIINSPRYPMNRIVRFCLENNTNLNEIWNMALNGMFNRSEMKQFYKLIGYSKRGFVEINFLEIDK